MNFNQILNDLNNKIYHPIYFLMGEEDYFIDQITNFIHKNVLTESEKTFNQTVLYGKDTDISTVINTAKRFPMMANHQVVILKEAQHLKSIEDLIHYAKQPLKSTILVINYKYKKLDKRKQLYKNLQSNAVLFEAKKLYDNELPAWVDNYLSQKNRSIEPKANALLIEYLGNSLSKIVNEVDKLIITLPEGETKINTSHIERNIGISKDYNTFELHNALAKKDVLKANRIVHFFNKNPKDNPLVVTLSMLYYFFSKVLTYQFIKDKRNKKAVAATLKVNPFFLKEYEMAGRAYTPKKVVQIIGWLREYDLRSKGKNNVSTPDGELLRELIYKILH